MTITVKEVEIEAIQFAIKRIESEVDYETNEVFLNDADRSLKALYSVIEKYQAARYKANTFQQIRAEVSRQNRSRHLSAREIDKMARKVVKRLKEEKKL